MNISKITPLEDRVVIRIDWGQAELGGNLVRPETGRKPFPKKGVVLAIGPGKLVKGGRRILAEVAVGDRVVFQREHGEKVEINGDDCLIMEQEHILGIIGEDLAVFEQ